MPHQLSQAGILTPVPRAARYLYFRLAQAEALPDCLEQLAQHDFGDSLVLGLGTQAIAAFGPGAVQAIEGMRDLATLVGAGVTLPAVPVDLWCWLRGEDLGGLLHLGRRLEKLLAPALVLERVVDGFRYGRGPNGHGRDLTGYEDGTENPAGAHARDAALVQGRGAGLDGSSFVAVQQWRHDLAAFDAMSTTEQDHTFGRQRGDNEEIQDAPASAHVKRMAHESFEPEAFVVRRSMPWTAGMDAGLLFVAFGRSFDDFEALLRRMAGLDDGVVDAIFGISRPLDGAYFWCPPAADGKLDLRALNP